MLYVMKLSATIVCAFGAVGISISSPALADEHLSAEEAEWLTAHNQARKAFGTAPLRWSDKLARDARVWAEQLARENTIRHSAQDTRNPSGENLWMGTRGYFPASRMIGYFVDEQRYFQAGRFPNVSITGNWSDVGHYTQIVWTDTREVGCAKASNAQNDVLVCRYFPGGNVIGQRIAPLSRVARR